MGHVKDIANQPKLQTFPSTNYEVANLAPVAQCEAPTIDLFDATFFGSQQIITLAGAFVGFDLTGKIAKVTSPGPAIGEYPITSNTDDVLHIITVKPGEFGSLRGRVKDAAGEYITRSANSFARFFASRGDPFTIKGGMLYTTVPLATMQLACPTTFAPLT